MGLELKEPFDDLRLFISADTAGCCNGCIVAVGDVVEIGNADDEPVARFLIKEEDTDTGKLDPDEIAKLLPYLLLIVSSFALFRLTIK